MTYAVIIGIHWSYFRLLTLSAVAAVGTVYFISTLVMIPRVWARLVGVASGRG